MLSLQIAKHLSVKRRGVELSPEAQAANWILTLDADPSPELRARFVDWRNANMRHRIASRHLEIALERAGLIHNFQQTGGDGHDGQPLLCAPPSSGTFPPVLRWLTRTVPVLFLAGFGLLMLPPPGKTIASNSLEQKHVALDDGSDATLAAASKMKVTPGGIVELQSGKATISVGRGQRPLEVRAGKAVARATGASFAVRIDASERVEIAVTEGRVEFATGDRERDLWRTPQSISATTLRAGERASVTGDRLRIVTFLERRLTFNREPLDNVVRDINLFHDRQLRIDDPSIRSLRISGTFDVTAFDAFVGALVPLGIRAETRGMEVFLHHR